MWERDYLCYYLVEIIRRSEEISQPRTNEAIRAAQLRVIAEDGSQLGVLSRAEALRLAAESDLDLVEVSANTDPPVARIVDWGKYNYQRTKQLQKSKRSSKVADVKQIRMGLKIGEHDLDIKLRKARDFLEAGHKVKITLVYRGRELAHRDLGFSLAQRIITEKLADTAAVDSNPQFAGRQLSFVIRKDNAKAKNAQSNQQAPVGDQDRQGSV